MGNRDGVTHVADPDRVSANPHTDVNAPIDRGAEERVRAAAAEPDVDHRLATLGREWDFERVIETEAAATGLVGLALAVL